MRLSPKFLRCFSLFLLWSGCNSAAAASNPLIGTWIRASDQPSYCTSKYIFTEKSGTGQGTMYVEDPGVPGLVPPSSHTVRVAYSVGPKGGAVQNLSTGRLADWILSDATHAITGNTAECHYVKQ